MTGLTVERWDQLRRVAGICQEIGPQVITLLGPNSEQRYKVDG